jgi:hypothetical protein
MERLEIEQRVKGMDDFMRMFYISFRNMALLNEKFVINEKDFSNMKEMLMGIRNVLIEKYRRENNGM